MSQVKRLETDLAVIIQNRRWRKFSSPFKHILARNVFIPTFYRELESAFAEALRSGALGTSRFRYNGTSMDAFDLTFDRDVATPFSTFFSNTWLQLLGGLFDLRPCRYVSGGLHHHPIGSASGDIHNDLNPGWFASDPPGTEPMVSDPRDCHYKTGSVPRGHNQPVEAVRGVALILYLANAPWSPGDGGETGLYSGPVANVEAPVIAVPPINNSLLAFECTPWSFHAFLANRVQPRNSLIMWAHRERQEVVERWGADAIVDWS